MDLLFVRVPLILPEIIFKKFHIDIYREKAHGPVNFLKNLFQGLVREERR
jgi:hypothetical protein